MVETTSNIVVSKSGVQVTVGLNRLVENGNKALTLITTPKSGDNRDITVGKNDTQIVDLLLKAERRYTVTGDFITGLGTLDTETPDTHSDASDKKDDMRKIFFAGGVFDINIFGSDYTANADKYEFIWQANDKDTISSWGVVFTLIIGVDVSV